MWEPDESMQWELVNITSEAREPCLWCMLLAFLQASGLRKRQWGQWLGKWLLLHKQLEEPLWTMQLCVLCMRKDRACAWRLGWASGVLFWQLPFRPVQPSCREGAQNNALEIPSGPHQLPSVSELFEIETGVNFCLLFLETCNAIGLFFCHYLSLFSSLLIYKLFVTVWM